MMRGGHATVATLVHAPESPLSGVLRACDRIAASGSTVLLTGETGTGKEVFARLLHARSPRSRGPLVPVNCAAIPETLLESELFGYARGAFTGAVAARKGRISLAEGGTLFLDEIGELPLALQPKLLRLLQERRYEPVGSSESIAADFRLIAATHRNLAADVEAGRFRADLYYRLNVCPLDLPALRRRRTDIPLLFRHFWELRGERRSVDPDVLSALEGYDWPGNVRELENIVERLSVCAEGDSLTVDDLPPSLRTLVPSHRGRSEGIPPPHRPADPVSLPTAAPADPALTDLFSTVPPSFPLDLNGLLRRIEAHCIEAALRATGGNRKEAAALLGLQRTTLVEKLRRLSSDAASASSAPVPDPLRNVS